MLQNFDKEINSPRFGRPCAGCTEEIPPGHSCLIQFHVGGKKIAWRIGCFLREIRLLWNEGKE